jgi:hypothetical protein
MTTTPIERFDGSTPATVGASRIAGSDRRMDSAHVACGVVLID